MSSIYLDRAGRERYLFFMPPGLEAEIDARKAAEGQIVQLLRRRRHPLQVSEVVQELRLDEGTLRRAILRLAASGRAVVDDNFNLSLP
jgi:hypothetical protein